MFKTLGNLGLSKIINEGFNKKVCTESFCTKKNMLIETLREEILTVASRETEFEYQDQSIQYSIITQFGPKISFAKI